MSEPFYKGQKVTVNDNDHIWEVRNLGVEMLELITNLMDELHIRWYHRSRVSEANFLVEKEEKVKVMSFNELSCVVGEDYVLGN